MPRHRIIFAFFLLVLGFQSKAKQLNLNRSTVIELSQNELQILNEKGPGPLIKLLHKKERISRKATAAMLAFPFPFGMAGVHRIYLGCAPYIPVVYIGSLGGIFGTVPLIDFCVILASDDVEKFANSGKVFMWIE